jgi:sulfonate transport system substrate-binding protein
MALKQLTALGTFFAFALALALIGAPRADAESITIRVGQAGIGPGGTRFVPGLVGLIGTKRYLEREFEGDPDIKIEWYYFKGAGPAVNEALASNQLDFAYEGDLPSLTGRAAGLRTRILMATHPRDNLYLIAPIGSDIRSLADVKGRKVAQFRGTSTHLTTERVLAQHDLKTRDIQFFNMDDGTALAALASGDVEAAFTKDDPSTVTSGHLMVTEAFEKAHPDLVARVVKASVEAAAWASDETHREQLYEIWAKSGMPIGVFRADYEGQTLAYRVSPLLDELFIENYRYKARQVKALGLVRRDIDLNSWFEPKYLDSAIKQLGLEKLWTRYGADGKPVGS